MVQKTHCPQGVQEEIISVPLHGTEWGAWFSGRIAVSKTADGGSIPSAPASKTDSFNTMRNTFFCQKYRFLSTALFILFFTSCIVFIVNAEEADISTGGSNNMRIEEEDKLFVPLEKADEVWKYLYDKYVVNKEEIKKLDPLFETYNTDEEFTDTYFDTPDLKLLAMQSGVRYRYRVNLTNPNDVKSGRELMQIKLGGISSNPLQRGEFKFNIRHPQEIKNTDDAHPMLAMVEQSQRQDFKQQLTALGLDPYAMRPILTVYDFRKRIYFEKDGTPFFSISFDNTSANMWWAKTNFFEIEPELNEITFTEADSNTRKYMEEVLGRVTSDIKAQFPFIHTDLAPKYNKSFKYIEAQLPFTRFLIKFNIHNMGGMIVVILIALLTLSGGVYFIVNKIHQRKTCHTIGRSASGGKLYPLQ